MKKNIVIVSPFYNGLYRYTSPLVEELKKKYSKKYNIYHIGNPNMTFEISEIESIVDKMANDIIKLKPDIIHYNYGTYDVEQLIPYFLEKKGYKFKSFLTYHSLQLDIFKKIDQRKYDRIVNKYMGKMDGYVFFTEYAHKIFQKKYPNNHSKYVVSYHPATHLNNKISKEKILEYDKLFNIDRKKPIATLLGYSSHWKNTRPIIKLVKKFPDVVFFIGGPWWKEKILKENKNIDIEKLTNLIIVNRELDIDEFNYAMELGVGLFPYKYFPSFQGSGLLPNYLYRGINTVVSDIEPLKEYKKNKVVDFNDTKQLYKEFEYVINHKKTERDLSFSYSGHAQKIEELYRGE